MKKFNRSQALGYSFLTLLAFLGVAGAGWRMIEGLKVTSLTAFEPWGVWVVTYSFLIGLSGGCVLISSLYTVFGKKEFKDVVGPALLVALISLVGGVIFIWLELGQPFRILNLYLYPNWETGMARLAWLYPIYLVMIAVELYLWLKPKAAKKKSSIQRISVFSVVLALLVNWNLGNVFASSFTQHLWGTEWTPPVYLGLAIISGLGMGLILQAFCKKQRISWATPSGNLTQYLWIVLALYTFFIVEEMIRNGSLSTVLFGEHKYMFWVGQFGFLILLPAVLGWMGNQTHRPPLLEWAGLSVLAGIFAARLYVLIPEPAVAELNGMGTVYHGDRLTASGFLPNLLETGVILGLLALLVLAFLVLNRMLGKWVPRWFLNT
jgi:molybdopterin-containing oxidoreductase family membrane subunit